MIVRYVCPLTEQQRALLESTRKNDASHRARMRAHGLLLSSEGITIKAIGLRNGKNMVTRVCMINLVAEDHQH